MSLEHNTSEPFKLNGDAADRVSAIEDVGRLVASKGRAFWEDFIGASVIPARREAAMLYVNAAIGSDGAPKDHEERDALIFDAWDFADAFCLADKVSLERNVAAYFEQYMSRGEANDVLQASIEANKDYSL